MMNALSTQAPYQLIQILVVEDEYILAMNMQECLESLGYDVVDIVDTAEAAIEKAAEQRPHLILMDIRLRGEMDGIQAAEQIWHQFQIPIIYVTGHSDHKTVERATLTFPFGYVLKPVNEKELYVAIQTALNRYQREQFLSSVLRGMGDGVVVVNTQLQIKYLNPAAEVLTGWKLEEVIEREVTEVLQFIDEITQMPVEHPIVSALQHNTTIYLDGNTLLITKDDTTLPVADSATPIKDNNGVITGAVLVFRDDSRRRLIQECNLAHERTQQMQNQLLELQRLDHLKDDFLALTSHELRSPLSNIKLAICMLETILNQRDIFSLESEGKAQSVTRYLTVLRDQCDQELKLVNDLLDMRSMEAQAYPLEENRIQLQTWLPHLVESFEERIRVQQQRLQLKIPPELPPLISDLSSLTRIVSELLHNACKYTPAQEQIQVIVQLAKDKNNHTDSQNALPKELAQIPFVQIIIRNSGINLPAEQLSRIFEPFYRIPSKKLWKQEGTGLGLAFAQKLTHYLQGKLTVNSTQGWVTFTVELPLKSSDDL
jgi:PAS domain S-box-containing protein